MWGVAVGGPNPYRSRTFDQVVDHVHVTLLDREKKSRLPGLVAKVHLKAQIEQELDYDQIAARCSIKQRRLPMQIDFLKIDSRCDALFC